MANAELGCQHLTILAHHLKELRECPATDEVLARYPFLKSHPPKKEAPYYERLETPERFKGHLKIDPLAGPDWDGKLADIHQDYLSDNGKALQESIRADPVVIRKLQDVVDAFVAGETQAKAAIDKEWARLSS